MTNQEKQKKSIMDIKPTSRIEICTVSKVNYSPLIVFTILSLIFIIAIMISISD